MFFWKSQPAVPPAQPLAFANFSPAELWALSLAPITHVDLQHGCPWQCLGCAVDAPPPNLELDMRWKQFESIAKGAGRVKKEFGLSVFTQYGVNLNYKSDGIGWKPRDTEGKGLWDGAKLLHDECGVQTTVTIPGFASTDAEATRNVTACAADILGPEAERVIKRLGYSVKLFQRWALADIDRFLDSALQFFFNASADLINEIYGEEARHALFVRETLGQLYEQDPATFLLREDIWSTKINGAVIDSTERDEYPWLEWFVLKNRDAFFQGSKFVQNTVQNLEILRGNQKIVFDRQSNWDEGNIPIRNKRYQPFFTGLFVIYFIEHCMKKANFKDPGMSFGRNFSAFGRAVDDLGLQPATDSGTVPISNMIARMDTSYTGFMGLEHHFDVPKGFVPPEIRSEVFFTPWFRNLHASISTDGRLRFHHSIQIESNERAYVPPEFFKRCAETPNGNQFSADRKIFSLLAGMAERDVFGGR